MLKKLIKILNNFFNEDSKGERFVTPQQTKMKLKKNLLKLLNKCFNEDDRGERFKISL